MSDLSSKLAEARAAMEMPQMNGVGHAGRNGSREYKYALLQDVIACIMPPLLERGVLLTQGFEGSTLVTKAVLGDEEMVLDSRPVVLTGTPQEQGSAETYAKRYALCTVFCIAGQDDDDGAGANESVAHLNAARTRLWSAVKAYAAKTGQDAKMLSANMSLTPAQSADAAYLEAKAMEFEEACNAQ